jgi:hypothetical protein
LFCKERKGNHVLENVTSYWSFTFGNALMCSYEILLFMTANSHVLITLILISALGVVAIPFGNPKFIGESIIVELSFIMLSVLVWRGYTKVFYACIALAITVIIGNTTSPAHIHLMATFSKPINALILIIGGYVLQGILIYTSLKTILRIRRLRSVTQPSTI